MDRTVHPSAATLEAEHSPTAAAPTAWSFAESQPSETASPASSPAPDQATRSHARARRASTRTPRSDARRTHALQNTPAIEGAPQTGSPGALRASRTPQTGTLPEQSPNASTAACEAFYPRSQRLTIARGGLPPPERSQLPSRRSREKATGRGPPIRRAALEGGRGGRRPGREGDDYGGRS
jgi:hypothetical protein